MDRRELIGPEHLNRAGTRQEEGVGILLLSVCFLLFCALFFFFLIPHSNQEVIGIQKNVVVFFKKSPAQMKMENSLGVRSVPENWSQLLKCPQDSTEAEVE